MAQVYRESRYRDDSPSGDESYRRTTTRRYKQAPSHSRERVYEREIDVIDDDRQGARLDSRFYGRPTGGELVVGDRRDERLYPDRPRSTAGQGTTYVERRYRETEDWDGDNIPDRERTVVEKRLVRNDDDYHYRHDSSRNRDNDGWERHSYYDAERDAEVRVERKVERREDGSEVILERRIREHIDHDHGADVEIYRKETEYYEPAPQPQPIVIRQRPAEQRIILQEAAPPTVVVRERRDDFAPYVVEKTEEEYIVEHIDDHSHHSHSRHRDGHHSHSRSHHRHEDEEHYAGAGHRRDDRRSRSRSSSGSPHRKRHIAEGALAGAGVSALIASRRNKETGEVDKHRGRKIVAGAALGALGTEAVRRAHSAYKDRHPDSDDEHDHRSRSRSRSHSRIKTGLGIAAVALAAAGAAKYYESKKIEKEEAERGRPPRRYSESDYSRSPSRKRSKSRASSVAKAALGTAAAVGVVQHYRHKRSKSRHGSRSRSRSSSSDRSGHHSKLKTGAEIVAAGVAAGAAKKLYDKHKEKKERSRSRHAPDNRDREFYDDDRYDDRNRDYRSHSRSRSRSQHRFG